MRQNINSNNNSNNGDNNDDDDDYNDDDNDDDDDDNNNNNNNNNNDDNDNSSSHIPRQAKIFKFVGKQQKRFCMFKKLNCDAATYNPKVLKITLQKRAQLKKVSKMFRPLMEGFC